MFLADWLSQHRVRVFSRYLETYIQNGDVILDYGCGNGTLASFLLTYCQTHGKHIEIIGYDPFERSEAKIPISNKFESIPKKPYSLLLLVDVIHHIGKASRRRTSKLPADLLSELRKALSLLAPSARVLVKDYLISPRAFPATLQRMSLTIKDVLTNPGAVNQPFRYFSLGEWRVIFAKLRLHLMHEFNSPYLPLERLYQGITGRSVVFVLKRHSDGPS